MFTSFLRHLLTTYLVKHLASATMIHGKQVSNNIYADHLIALVKVAEMYTISKMKGWILPTVYQGRYNAMERITEDECVSDLDYWNHN